MDFLKQHVEALIFVSPQATTLAEICAVLTEVLEAEVPEADVLAAIEQLREQYAQDGYAFELVEIAGGYQLLTKGAYHNTVAVYLKQTTQKRLSQATLETLAIVAYKQPVSKSDLEAIRGVNCDYTLQKLLEKELVVITGRSEGPGRPLLYATSDKFMDYLGIKDLIELPKPKDFKEVENTIGEAPESEERPMPDADAESASD
ncbi:MAG: SMC-Scp complex subunit ScpB [Lewinellaceae bacterium]|nr:SMC-Scp complex subunit ScpB [Saprospiraceae bacterium]MCB9332975.1 SMC-Scp complex subunit ScpB [Lewinellaceae bacterium]